jgi:hypothetical protein
MKAQKSSRHAPEIRASRTNAISSAASIGAIDPSRLKLLARIDVPQSEQAKVMRFVRAFAEVKEPRRPFVYRPVPVRRETRDLVRRLFPRFDESPAYWRFFSYLVTGDYRDYATGELIISREVLATIAGRKESTNFDAGKFLKIFQVEMTDVWLFEYRTTWVPNKKTRRALDFYPSREVEEALAAEDFVCGEGKICLCDGTVFNVAKQRALREQTRQRAIEASKSVKSKEAARVLDYLNNLPHHLFGKITRNAASAFHVVASIENERSRAIALSYLRSTLVEPQPFYQPTSGEGDRLFGIGGCLTMLSKEVRAALAPDWHEADLANAQLSICAKLWGIKEVEEFLVKGGNIWRELMDHMEIPASLHQEAKGALKDSLYAACYGMSKDNLQNNVEVLLGGVGIVRSGVQFVNHPIIKAILKARGRMTKKVKIEGGMETCFGRFIPINKGWQKRKDAYGPRKQGRRLYDGKAVKPHQILAMVSQAQEMQLLLPAFELAFKHRRDFTITLFQHDGFSVKILRRPEYWKRRIKESVGLAIKEKGFLTSLEWK